MSINFEKIQDGGKEAHPVENIQAPNKSSHPIKVEHEFKSLLHISQKKTENSKKADEFAEKHFEAKGKQRHEAPKSITVHDIYPVSHSQTSSLEFIAKSGKLFLRHVKAQAEIVDLEVKHTRETKHLDHYWMGLKKAFQARLDHLNQKRQQNQ